MSKNLKVVLSGLLVLICFVGCENNTFNKNTSQSVKKNVKESNSAEPLTIKDSKTEFLLNTVVRISLYQNIDESSWQAVFENIRDIENKMSRHLANSEISQINKYAGIKPVKVSADTFAVVEFAVKYAELTDGLFDPTIGVIVKLWDIGGENQHIPSQSEIDEKLKLVNYKNIKLDKENSSIMLLEKGMVIDLGGVAKGYACDKTVQLLKSYGVTNAILDFGGNIYLLGSKNTVNGYRVGIRNPFVKKNVAIVSIYAKNEAVVSSGDYERYFEVDGKRYHHIFDTSTGKPVESLASGVSVVTSNSMLADVLSTVLFLTQKPSSKQFTELFKDVEYVVLNKDKNFINTFSDFRKYEELKYD